MPAPTQITVPDLLRALGTPDAPHIIDVCIDADFAEDPFLIPGSVRHPHTDLAGLRESLRGQPAIIICQKGLKLSQGVAAWLRAEGLNARYLAGGMFAWREAPDAPRVPASALPPRVDDARLWVTAQQPDVDRLASLWLIRRFLDRDARYLFVDQAEVQDIADRFGAVSFETFATPLAATGACVTFDDMLARFHLSLPALRDVSVKLAEPTLRAICDGLRHGAKCDLSHMDAMLPVFDALYANASATHEGRAA